MIRLRFSPLRYDGRLEVTCKGEVLTINGEEYDLSFIPEGATLPCKAAEPFWFAGDIHREAGELLVTLTLPFPAGCTDRAVLFPADMLLTEDGPVTLPGAVADAD